MDAVALRYGIFYGPGASDMFVTMAAAVGAPRPVRLPAALVRLGATFAGSQMLDMSMRVSNDRAADELGWRPRWPSYREGLTTLS